MATDSKPSVRPLAATPENVTVEAQSYSVHAPGWHASHMHDELRALRPTGEPEHLPAEFDQPDEKRFCVAWLDVSREWQPSHLLAVPSGEYSSEMYPLADERLTLEAAKEQARDHNRIQLGASHIDDWAVVLEIGQRYPHRARGVYEITDGVGVLRDEDYLPCRAVVFGTDGEVLEGGAA